MGKGKTNLFRLLFGRKTLGLLLLLLQIGLLTACYIWLREYASYLFGLSTLLTAGLILYEINREENPSFKLTWVILIGAIPVFGALLYLFIHLNWVSPSINRKLRAILMETRPFLTQSPRVMRELETHGGQSGLARYIGRSAGYPTYQNTSAAYLPTGEDKWEALLNELEGAERFIFLEYFIIARGEMWNSILDVLARKVRQGVEVRLMYDGMGCMTLLPQEYPKAMEALGIKCKVFSPIRPLLSTYQNNRDHRKIAVIDGRTAFTGGINLADEYVNRLERFGHWKDTAVMLKGDAVNSFTLMFLQLWNLTERQHEDYGKYLAVPPLEPSGDGFVTPYGDSPLDRELVGKQVYLDILNTARQYVHLTTPYLILDDELLAAMKYAVKRGVEVSIIMPHIPDKWYAFALSRTYYPELIQTGVRIYEYTPGFVHSKITVSDDSKAVVGTINYDFRSLYLHYECAAYLFQSSAVGQIEADFQQTLPHCRRITQEDYKHFPLSSRMAGRMLRLIAPLM